MHLTEHESVDRASIAIDCTTCIMRLTEACDDCLVTYICDREPDEAVVVTIDELRSLRMLSDAGLVPELQHRSRPA